MGVAPVRRAARLPGGARQPARAGHLLGAVDGLARCAIRAARRWPGIRLRAVELSPHRAEARRAPCGRSCFLDATEQGDLLPLAGAEFLTGSGVAHADARAQRADRRASRATSRPRPGASRWSTAPDEDHRIEEPAQYTRWRDFVPDLTPPWTGRQLALEASHPITLAPRHYRFAPPGGAGGQGRRTRACPSSSRTARSSTRARCSPARSCVTR